MFPQLRDQLVHRLLAGTVFLGSVSAAGCATGASDAASDASELRADASVLSGAAAPLDSGAAQATALFDARVNAQPVDAGEDPFLAALALAPCAAFGGSAPRQVADVVARLNQLPAPASIACLVASLPRPLSLVATASFASAQPSGGSESPRIFIMSDALVLSVVPAGLAQDLLEFGQWVTPTRTLKAELQFPIEQPISDDAPYVRIYGGQSVSRCGFCHANETPHPTIPQAFVSDALRVSPRYEVSLSDLRAIRARCDSPAGNGPQCHLLRALFDYGEVRQGAFDSAVKLGF